MGFSTAAYGSRDMARRRGDRAARQYEFLERLELSVEAIDGTLDGENVLLFDAPLAGRAELRADVEQALLRFQQAIADLVRCSVR